MRCCLNKHHPNLVYVEVAVVLAQNEPDQLRDRARRLDAGRSTADDHKRQQLPPAIRVVGPTRRFELGENVIPNRQAFVEVLQSHRVLRQRSVAEVVGLRACGQDQVVVMDRSTVSHQMSANEVHAGDRSLAEVGVLQRPDQLPYGTRDLTGVEQRRRDLVEEWSEEVVVVAVDQQHVHGCVLERPRARQARKSRARDDHPRTHLMTCSHSGGLRCPFCGGYRPPPPWRRVAIFSTASTPPIALRRDRGSFCFFLSTGSNRSPSLSTRFSTWSESKTSRLGFLAL